MQRALAQHAAYCLALRECGLEVTLLPPDERFPDGTFVEDTAVVAERAAVSSRPGAPTRQGEAPAIAARLGLLRSDIEHIKVPGTLDGGDVCQVDEHFLIGLSARTNEAGATQLADILKRHGYTASLIDIRSHPTLLHLKSGVAYLGDRRFTVSSDAPEFEGLEGYERIEVADDESYAANCVRVNDSVLLAAGFPKLAARLKSLGYAVRSLEMSEFQKMDGGLSCLSIRF